MIAIEMCAGAGGQALGLHEAGFQHAALIEIDRHACETLRLNNEQLGLGWGDVIEGDLKEFAKLSAGFAGRVDLVAGGVPCPPFSKAGQQLGHKDERDLFPIALQVVKKVKPRAVMLENVPGLFEEKFRWYRDKISAELTAMGYKSEWKLHQASDYGVPQLRPRVILVAMHQDDFQHFTWPEPVSNIVTVGDALYDLISGGGWEGAEEWRERANRILQLWLVVPRSMAGLPSGRLGPNVSGVSWGLMPIDWPMMMRYREKVSREP